MRSRDIARLESGARVVISLRELGVRGPEELATFQEFQPDRFGISDRRRRFSVCVVCHGAYVWWILPAALLRRASADDMMRLEPRRIDSLSISPASRRS